MPRFTPEEYKREAACDRECLSYPQNLITAGRLERRAAMLDQAALTEETIQRVRAWADKGPNEDNIRHLYQSADLRKKFTERELAIAVKCARQMMLDDKAEVRGLLGET